MTPQRGEASTRNARITTGITVVTTKLYEVPEVVIYEYSGSGGEPDPLGDEGTDYDI